MGESGPRTALADLTCPHPNRFVRCADYNAALIPMMAGRRNWGLINVNASAERFNGISDSSSRAFYGHGKTIARESRSLIIDAPSSHADASNARCNSTEACDWSIVHFE